MEEKSEETNFEFVRVRDKYFQRVLDPNLKVYTYIYRDKNELKADGVPIGNANLVKRFNGFTNSPNNIEYKRNIDSYFNLYEENIVVAKEGNHPNIDMFIKHIFQDQYLLGLDYLTILWRIPKQLLPILVLVSKIQSTGKTTFLEFMKLIFNANATILSVYQYAQQFNALFASKLIIGIDESAIKEDFLKEKIKQDATSKTIYLRKMFLDHMPLPFYAKFILSTNSEIEFCKLENEDQRFWVIKVPKIEQFDPDFMNKLEAEIPAFVFTLNNRKILTKNESRLWFNQDLIRTDALKKVIENSKSICAKELQILIADKLENIENFKATATDLYELLDRKFYKTIITKALKEELGYSVNEIPKYYTNYQNINKSGRFYEFTKSNSSDNTTDNSDLNF